MPSAHYARCVATTLPHLPHRPSEAGADVLAARSFGTARSSAGRKLQGFRSRDLACIRRQGNWRLDSGSAGSSRSALTALARKAHSRPSGGTASRMSARSERRTLRSSTSGADSVGVACTRLCCIGSATMASRCGRMWASYRADFPASIRSLAVLGHRLPGGVGRQLPQSTASRLCGSNAQSGLPQSELPKGSKERSHARPKSTPDATAPVRMLASRCIRRRCGSGKSSRRACS